MTILERIAAARTRFAAAGIPAREADLDARLLARWLLAWDASLLLTRWNETGPPDFPARFEGAVSRRERREPVAYITGRQEFWGRTFEVSRGVLIPRPETEAIVEAALEYFGKNEASMSIADVGTGSGCLAVTLAAEIPSARVLATDLSAPAIAMAARNASAHSVLDRVELVQTDLLDGVERTFDLVVSNPPYVPERERPTLQPEVRDYEPAIALFSAGDGLTVVERLLESSAACLNPGGRLIFEFGYGQADAVRQRIARTAELTLVELRADLQKIPRTAIVQRARQP